MFVPVAVAEPRNGPVPRARRSRARAFTPYLYLLPAVVLLVVWTYKPLGEAVVLSFSDWNMIPTSPRKFIGFDNYVDVLTLPELHQAVGNTVIYIAAFLVFSLVLPVAIGLASRHVRGRAKTVYQAFIFVPFLITPVATSAVWRWLFEPQGGTIPAIAHGLGWNIGNVFRDPAFSLWAIVVIVGWQMLGFAVLVVAAGLSGINPDYAAAASLDGAGPRQIVTRITLPLLSPTLVFLGLMTILLAAQWTYPSIDILTLGGPSGSSTNIYYLLYQFGFRNFDAGLAAAAGTLFFLGFGLIAWLFVELTERLSFYDN
jgi:multiple sugar transport system permease protein